MQMPTEEWKHDHWAKFTDRLLFQPNNLRYLNASLQFKTMFASVQFNLVHLCLDAVCSIKIVGFLEEKVYFRRKDRTKEKSIDKNAIANMELRLCLIVLYM